MVTSIDHIAITVADLERSVHFYKNILGFTYRGSVIKQGNEIDGYFQSKGCVINVGFLTFDDDPISQPIIELIEFRNPKLKEVTDDPNILGATKFCFLTDNLEEFVKGLNQMGISYIKRQEFYDLRVNSYTQSDAVCLRDPDGYIIEMRATH
ncbi:MAG: VOC family protein [Marinifilaceae bacterium]